MLTTGSRDEPNIVYMRKS